MELETSKKTELAKFDSAKKAVNEITSNLKGFVITDSGTRERLFTMSRDANGIKNQIDQKRLELQRPLTADIKRIKAKYAALQDAEINPINTLSLDIGTYSKGLMDSLETTISGAKTNILAFDKIEADRKEKERLRLEEEDRKAEQARKEKVAAEEKAERERVAKETAAADEKRKAENKTGIQAKLAEKEAKRKREAQEKEAADKRRADEEAEAKRKADFEKKTAELSKKTKGSVKYDYSHELINIGIVPGEYLLIKLDIPAIQKAQKEGIENIPGLKLNKTEKLGFR